MSAKRRVLTLLLMASLLAASLIAAFPLGVALAVDACSGASSITDYGYYYVVEGTKGNDTINCSSSDKPVYVKASWGDDTVTGSAYGDWLLGGWGDDTMYGLAGNDYLYGGHGGDWLDGGDDTDTCLGGRGWDGLTACETADYGLQP